MTKRQVHLAFAKVAKDIVGIWAAGGRGGRWGLQPPHNLGNLDFLSSKRNLGKTNFYISLHIYVRVFFSKTDHFLF